MKIELTDMEFRRLLDLAYVGNWVLNSIRGEDRIDIFDKVESKLFSQCEGCGMESLVFKDGQKAYPSLAFVEGGIHDAIIDYEDQMFFHILAQELARRDLGDGDEVNQEELNSRILAYIAEFEQNGIDNILVDVDL